MLTCIHAESGLCPRCQADYDEDPSAYIEFGDHPEGVARWQALQAEMDAERETEAPCEVDNDITF